MTQPEAIEIMLSGKNVFLTGEPVLTNNWRACTVKL